MPEIINAIQGKNKGFTLIEVLIAVTIILMMAVAFVPLFVFVAEASQANKARLVATKLASNEIEYVRSLSYQDIGTIGGNPAGLVERVKEVTVNNITYTIVTDIWWVDDPSDDNVSGFDPIPYDYKRVKVAVSSPSVFSSAITQIVDINTLAVLEGGEEAFPGGNIRANVIRGWNVYDDIIPVPNAGINLSSGPSAPQFLATNEFGTALFAIITEGDYTVAVNPAPLGMMAKDLDHDIPVVHGITSDVIFELEYPCFIEIELRDKNSGQRITSDGTIVLKDPIFGDRIENFTSLAHGYLNKNFFGDLWPIGEGSVGTPYRIAVYANGYFSKEEEDVSSLWDGQFSQPGELKVIQVELEPINASILVKSGAGGSPVMDAEVKVYQNIYTYNGSIWVEEQLLIKTETTGLTGSVTLSLENNTEMPLDPEEGDKYSPDYSIEVEAAGFHPSGLIANAFNIQGNEMFVNGISVDDYEVLLETMITTGSIRVRTQRTNGNPRNGVYIRVTGPNSYSQVIRTNSGGVPGIAVFEDLPPGSYQVRRSANGVTYTDLRSVIVVAGQEVFVLYSY